MTLAEATRQYQVTLTAVRSAQDVGTDEDLMYEELEVARRAMNTAWLKYIVQ